ncbi:argininosuccinate lyase [Parasulfitobacter algicola]|uniref:Argininosuccinate lyase n=1 Tax=Parasulfitobacter algicola TaxID=2614809 RepID=A0ABX2IPD4_9RHOB|nr:argininosuccinate lyase [Sulfitobacter algicola]NSX53846.1 argininosuccinate lyase [Sulfitobacter algicola]
MRALILIVVLAGCGPSQQPKTEPGITVSGSAEVGVVGSN